MYSHIFYMPRWEYHDFLRPTSLISLQPPHFHPWAVSFAMADSSSWGPKPELIPEVASLFLIVPKTSSVQATRKILPVIHLDVWNDHQFLGYADRREQRWSCRSVLCGPKPYYVMTVDTTTSQDQENRRRPVWSGGPHLESARHRRCPQLPSLLMWTMLSNDDTPTTIKSTTQKPLFTLLSSCSFLTDYFDHVPSAILSTDEQCLHH